MEVKQIFSQDLIKYLLSMDWQNSSGERKFIYDRLENWLLVDIFRFAKILFNNKISLGAGSQKFVKQVVCRFFKQAKFSNVSRYGCWDC